ncbi:hypothetical protein ACIRPS_18125 [Streptomyces griseoviridis]
MSWRYDLYVCDCGYERPEDHDGTCGAWSHAGTWLNDGFRDAFKAAAREAHAYVETTSPHTGNTAVAFKHINVGGLCEICGPATGRRGPWTRSVAFTKFLCAECAASLQAASDGISKSMGVTRWRSVRPVLDDAEL